MNRGNAPDLRLGGARPGVRCLLRAHPLVCTNTNPESTDFSSMQFYKIKKFFLNQLFTQQTDARLMPELLIHSHAQNNSGSYVVKYTLSSTVLLYFALEVLMSQHPHWKTSQNKAQVNSIVGSFMTRTTNINTQKLWRTKIECNKQQQQHWFEKYFSVDKNEFSTFQKDTTFAHGGII